jgi:hypothetical protein
MQPGGGIRHDLQPLEWLLLIGDRPRCGDGRANLRRVLGCFGGWIGFVKGFAGEAARGGGRIAGRRSGVVVLEDMKDGWKRKHRQRNRNGKDRRDTPTPAPP